MQPSNQQPEQPVQPAVTPPLVEPSVATAPVAESSGLAPYSWRASEYIYHAKPASWYLGLWLLVAIVCGGLVYLQQWLSIGVAIMMALAITIYTRKEPRELNYRLDDHGVTVEDKTIPFMQFKSFSVAQEMAWHEVDLEPIKRFVPRLTLLCDSDELPQVETILAAHLPRDDREPDWVERTSRRLRF